MKEVQNQYQEFLNNLSAAILNKDKAAILKLYDENASSSLDWDTQPDTIQQEYDTLTDRANEIVYG